MQFSPYSALLFICTAHDSLSLYFWSVARTLASPRCLFSFSNKKWLVGCRTSITLTFTGSFLMKFESFISLRWLYAILGIKSFGVIVDYACDKEKSKNVTRKQEMGVFACACEKRKRKEWTECNRIGSNLPHSMWPLRFSTTWVLKLLTRWQNLVAGTILVPTWPGFWVRWVEPKMWRQTVGRPLIGQGVTTQDNSWE